MVVGMAIRLAVDLDLSDDLLRLSLWCCDMSHTPSSQGLPEHHNNTLQDPNPNPRPKLEAQRKSDRMISGPALHASPPDT